MKALNLVDKVLAHTSDGTGTRNLGNFRVLEVPHHVDMSF